MTTATATSTRLHKIHRSLAWAGMLLTLACQNQTSAPPAPMPVASAHTSANETAVSARPVPSIEPEVTFRLQPDLWRDMRQGFALAHHAEQKRVRQELRWLMNHPQYLHNLKPRMERFLGYIHQAVAARDLPSELALLPIIESALDPYAFSHGGAAGLWQFIPATAKRFGLKRNWWYDGRRDPIAATEAGLDYLEYLYVRFDDWALAIAGYNAGEGNVRRAQRRAAPGASFWELALPRETRAYVPRLLALAALVADPQAYGIELPQVSPVVPFTVLDTHGQLDLMKAADTLSIDIDTLYRWNPAINQWATPPQGPHRLLVATADVYDAQALLSAIPQAERVQWLRIKVANGDTLSEIAVRHNTDTASLRKANQLTSSRIRAGQALYIPTSSKTLTDYPRARTVSGTEYFVKPGDSLWTISRAHHVSMNKLMKANHVGPKDVLRIGQRLSIPSGSLRGSRSVIREVRYGVRKGDSLAKIAARFHVRVTEIASWNQLNVNNYLQPGQSLKLYVNVVGGE